MKQGGASAAGIDQSIISHQHLMQNISLQRQETIKSWDTPTRGQKTQKHVLSVSRDQQLDPNVHRRHKHRPSPRRRLHGHSERSTIMALHARL